MRDYCKDPWNRFKMEVHFLRDYFVNEVIVSKVKTQEGRNINQTFFNLKNYEMVFLPTLVTKFGMETPSGAKGDLNAKRAQIPKEKSDQNITPTIIHFLKSKLFYPFEFSVNNKEEKGSNYKGWNKRGYETTELPVSKELISMQEMLD